HYHAWVDGEIRHRDPSLDNLMYRKDDIGKIHGVLNDWDLATNEESRHDGSERMGTLPFMAQELLDSIHWKLPIEHLYRHDLEAFYSILIWYC
ncbi:hypothetical protein DICSQDRAFT_20369, partial [Dichomitus squalens LYAD-421 SS1]